MGDGNHSLATAKAIWEQIKAREGMIDHPARYALVEIENIHDDGLAFEPIHRVLFDVKGDFVAALGTFLRRAATSCRARPPGHGDAGGRGRTRRSTRSGLSRRRGSASPSSAAQPPTCRWERCKTSWTSGANPAAYGKIDYVHGEDVTVRLGSQPGNMGFYLPAITKGDFFKTVILDGALPRKTFSMGEAKEKRFYMEARRIA